MARTHRHHRRHVPRGITSVVARAESSWGGVDGVYDESWNLGYGGFAERHLEDEEHIAAKEVSSFCRRVV